MERICLIPENLTKNGLSLWQEGAKLIVVTPCCGHPVDASNWRDIKCSSCKRSLHPEVAKDQVGWFGDLDLLQSGVMPWGPWMKFWFGIENTEIRVEL